MNSNQKRPCQICGLFKNMHLRSAGDGLGYGEHDYSNDQDLGQPEGGAAVPANPTPPIRPNNTAVTLDKEQQEVCRVEAVGAGADRSTKQNHAIQPERRAWRGAKFRSRARHLRAKNQEERREEFCRSKDGTQLGFRQLDERGS